MPDHDPPPAARRRRAAARASGPADNAKPDKPRPVVAGGFSQLINRAIRSGRLTRAGSAAQRLYSYLTYFAEPTRDFRLQVGVATLARIVGMARPTVRTGLDALVNNGLLAIEQPSSEGADGRGIPAVYRLLVPEQTDIADPALVRQLPAHWKTADQSPDASHDRGVASGAPAKGRATRHKQEGKTDKNTDKGRQMAGVVLLLKEEGVDDVAAMEFAALDPLHIRAVILTAKSKPNVRDVPAYIVKYLRMGWKPSPKLVEAAERLADSGRRREAEAAEADRTRHDLIEQRRLTADRLADLSDPERELLYEEAIREAGEAGHIYRRAGITHPASLAAMARLRGK